MVVVVGCVMVLGAVLTGFMLEGGHVGALIQPAELVVIGGAALGSLVVMSPVKVIKDLLRGILQCLKGTPYNKRAYEDLFKLAYEFLRLARKEGLLALEKHVSDPHASAVFGRYPRIANNRHVTEFFCGALLPIIEGTVTPERLPSMLEAEIKVIEEEHHAPLGVLTKTADALPGFGIVAAVLGIVITMGAIDGPMEQIGEKVGAALVGTFLGILMSYGFFAPLAVKMEFLGTSELAFFRTIASLAQGFVDAVPPQVAVERARRGVTSESRPSREEMEKLFAEVEGG